MILTDVDVLNLRKQGVKLVKPFENSALQPASYDVHLDDILWFDGAFHTMAPPIDDDEPIFRLRPHKLVLGSTIEMLSIPANLAARFEGISTLGRMGIMTHVTAGFIDPGFRGNLTLEIYNLSDGFVSLKRGMRIGQLCFYQTNSVTAQSYSDTGHYMDQRGPTPPAADNL